MTKASAPPIVQLRQSEPLQDYFSDGLGNHWSVARLIDAAKDEKEFMLPLAGMDLSYEIWRGSDIMMLAFHCKKVFDADLDVPIIIAWNGSIADGRHRIIKALIEGKPTIKAVRMSWRPHPCRTDNDE